MSKVTTAEKPVTRLTYRADIDGLRAIAVLMVAFFHFELVPYAEAGFLGVDVFFVISGYLITSIILSGTSNGTFRLVNFYANRIRRLAPALLMVLVLVLAFGAFWLFPVDFRKLAFQSLVTQFYVSNFYFWQNVNYFGLGADSVYLLHTWSLAVEEQFYLLYPISILLILRLSRRILWPIVWIATGVSFVLGLHFAPIKPEASFYLLPTRAWEILAGAICYQLVQRRYQHSVIAMEIMGLFGISLIIASIFAYEPDFSIPGVFAAVPVVGAVAIIYSGAHATTIVVQGLAMKVMVYVGRISYPLYLVHWPIDVLAQDHFQEDYEVSIRASMLAASTLIAALVYHFVEMPVRSAIKLRGARLVAGYAIALVCTVVVFAGSELTEGFPNRFPEDVVQTMEFANDHTESTEECSYLHEIGLSQSTCLIGLAEIEPVWLVYGDSHAWAARTVFDEWLKQRGEGGRFVFQNSCPPVIGLHLFGDQGKCGAFNDEALAMVLGSKTIDNVLLVSTWRQAIESRLSTSPFEVIGKAEGVALFVRQFSETVKRYANGGKKVYIWEPVPGAKANVPRALARAQLYGNKDIEASLSVSTKHYKETYQFFFDAIEANRKWITNTFSPSLLLCDQQICRAVLDGKPVYYDGSHISRSQFPHWVRMMEETDSSLNLGALKN